jgi:hypothetical protein
MSDYKTFPICDLARLAAFLDGEGHITIKSYRQRAHTLSREWINRQELKIAITNTDVRLPLWCKDTFGTGSVYMSDSRRTHDGQKSAYRWECGAKKAGALLLAVRPYVLLKKDQVEIALAFQSLMTGARISKASIAERLQLAERMNGLNRRGAKVVGIGG